MAPVPAETTAETKEADELISFDCSLNTEKHLKEISDEDMPIIPPCLKNHEPCRQVYMNGDKIPEEVPDKMPDKTPEKTPNKAPDKPTDNLTDKTPDKTSDDKKQLKYDQIISAHDAAQKAEGLRLSIAKQHTDLRKSLVGKEDGILKKWKGWKNSKKRTAISTACPELGSKQFVLDVLLGKVSTNASEHRSQFLLFPMTVETLSDSYQALLRLAHCRSSTRPEDCVGFDWEQLRYGLDQKAFTKIFAPGCVKMFGANFGYYFKHFNDVEVHSYQAFPTAAALLILERQDLIYQLLCRVLLPISDSITESKGSAEWENHAGRHFRRCEEVETLFQHIDGIFSSPIPDLSEMLHNVRGRKEYCEDELVALTCDVEHFVCRWGEFQMMCDASLVPESEEPRLATVATVVFEAFQDLLYWHFTEENLQTLMRVIHAHRNDLEWGQPRPAEYQDAYWKLTSLVEHRLHDTVQDLGSFYRSSTEFSQPLKRAKSQSRGTPSNRKSPKAASRVKVEEELYKTDRLHSLLRQLCHYFGNIPLVLPDLNRLLLKKEQANRLNYRMMQAISEIGDLWRLMEFCRYQRPAIPDPQQNVRKESRCLAARYVIALKESRCSEQLNEGGLLDLKFKDLRVARPYKERNAAWLAKVDHYQHQLKKGMSTARDLFLRMLVVGGLQDNDDKILLKCLIKPDTEKLYPVVSKEERLRISSPATKRKVSDEHYVPPPQESETIFKKVKVHSAEETTEEERSPSCLPTPPPRAELPTPPPQAEFPTSEVYRLPPRPYRLVNHLFAGGDHPQGQVTFQDFGRFMSALGFGQIALGGSEYRFFKAGNDSCRERSIVVHKRHPEPHYRADDLRRIGRRLSSRFGWTLDTFLLE